MLKRPSILKLTKQNTQNYADLADDDQEILAQNFEKHKNLIESSEPVGVTKKFNSIL